MSRLVLICFFLCLVGLVLFLRKRKKRADPCPFEWMEKAERGDANAQIEVGAWYSRKKTRKGYREARRWFEAAAGQGDLFGVYNLGLLYLHGHGVEKDVARAQAMFVESACNGPRDASFNLGVMHQDGQGVTADIRTALFFYKIAARRGNAAAMYNMGNLYSRGLAGEENRAQGWGWYRAAITKSHDPKDLVGYLTQFAKKGDYPAIGCLGQFHIHGRGGLCDRQKGFRLIRQAAEAGFAPAQATYGAVFQTQWRFEEAVHWYEKAAAQEDADGLCSLGVCYIAGWGVTPDPHKAFPLFRRSAALGYRIAQTYLAPFYEDGVVVPPDPKTAAYWYERAANGGSQGAQYRLAELYRDGIGVEADPVKAYMWLFIALEEDNNPDRPAWDRASLREKLTPGQRLQAERLIERKKRFFSTHISSDFN